MHERTSPSRLLLVACSENFCKTLRRILNRCGYEVDCTRSGEEALASLDRGAYDAIISEVHLPGEVCGITLMQQIRAAGHGVPIIFLTEQETARVRAALDAWEGVACLQMPLDVDRLKELVASRCASSERPSARTA
jgi:DNA-binding NtrC family response regulator